MTSTQRGLLRCGIAAGLFGATTPFAARLAHDTAAPILAGLLYIGAAVAVAPAVAKNRASFANARSAWRSLAIAVVLGGFLGPLLLATGLARTSGATAALLLNFELPATTLLAAVLFREHVGRAVVVGTVLVVSGGLAVSWSDEASLRFGALLIVAACICWAVDNCVTASLDSVSPAAITFAKGVIAGTCNLLIGVAVGGELPSFGTLAGAVVLGAFGYGLSITLWVSGARDLGAARGQLVFATAPFIGVAMAWVVLGETVQRAQLVGVVLAGIGVSTVVKSSHGHLHRHDALHHEHKHEHDEHHPHDHDAVRDTALHSHAHDHTVMIHVHPHVPDLHHRHAH